jgi:hypothetical protein
MSGWRSRSGLDGRRAVTSNTAITTAATTPSAVQAIHMPVPYP